MEGERPGQHGASSNITQQTIAVPAGVTSEILAKENGALYV